jgi:type 1 glutamine amidotransferase
MDVLRAVVFAALFITPLAGISGAEPSSTPTTPLVAGPSMPRDAKLPPPVPRLKSEVDAVLKGAPTNDVAPRNMRITLVAGPKDHGKGEHDYPAWQKVWKELLTPLQNLEVATAWEWPSEEDFTKSQTLVFYRRGTWSADKAAQIDAFLSRGGGLVYIHWAVDGGKDYDDVARRIGLCWGPGGKYRHGEVELTFNRGSSHPIARNFDRLQLHDESYWKLTGSLSRATVLATAPEDGEPQPLFWTIDHNPGRVFVSIPGHYSWSFDDPLYRILLLRGIAWTAGESVDRFNAAVLPGAMVVADPPRPTVVVKRTEDFEFSGDGSAAAWNSVPWTDLHVRPGGAHNYATRFKTLWSSTGLYLLMDGEDSKLTAQLNADNAHLWTEDVYEAFFWTDEKHPLYFEYEISPLGYELPILVPNFDGKFLGWLPWMYDGKRKTRKAVKIIGGEPRTGADIKGWRAELFFPWDLFRPLPNVPPKPGGEWRANFYRMDYDAGQRTQWDWSRVGDSFHDYHKFGTLRFE